TPEPTSRRERVRLTNETRADPRFAIQCSTEMSPSSLWLLPIIVFAIAVPTRSQTPPAYTASQAADGLATYQTNCASCHLPDLSGRNEAPPVAGVNFMNAWGSRTTSELIRYMQGNMPP